MSEQVSKRVFKIARVSQLIQPRRREAFFVVDAGIPDVDWICSQLRRAGIVLLLDPCDMPLQTIAAVLESVGGAVSATIIAPVDHAVLRLGGIPLTADTLDSHPDALHSIGESLDSAQNIRLYGRPADAGKNWFGTLAADLSVKVVPDLAAIA